MERTRKFKSLSLLLVFWLVFMLIFPIGTIESKASGGATYILPVTYYTSATKSTTVNVYMIISTTTIMPGTVITLIGIPTNSYISGGGYERVSIGELVGARRTWGFDYFDGPGEEILDGTVSYVVEKGKYDVSVVFGEWYDGYDGGGSDEQYTISLDGTVTNVRSQEIILPIGDESILETLNLIP